MIKIERTFSKMIKELFKPIFAEKKVSIKAIFP
jgi:hypothetical protein